VGRSVYWKYVSYWTKYDTLVYNYWAQNGGLGSLEGTRNRFQYVVPLREVAGQYSQFQESLFRDLENVKSEFKVNNVKTKEIFWLGFVTEWILFLFKEMFFWVTGNYYVGIAEDINLIGCEAVSLGEQFYLTHHLTLKKKAKDPSKRL